MRYNRNLPDIDYYHINFVEIQAEKKAQETQTPQITDNKGTGMKVSVIIPAYEPDEKMTGFVESLVSNKDTLSIENIVIVNDGSSIDALPYFDTVKSYSEVILLEHEKNRGKGAALKTAFAYLHANCPDIDCAVCADADGQHTVDCIGRCLEVFRGNPQQIVLGGRDFGTGNVPARSLWGNRISAFVYSFAIGIKLKDTQTGLRIIPSEYFEEFSELKGDRYEYETQMLITISNRKIPYTEVAIETIYIDDNASSHFNPLKDSAKIYGVVLRYFFKFIISSISSWVVDIGSYSILLYFIKDQVSVSEQVLICTIVSRVISSVFNYLMNRHTVFKATDNVAITALKYYILALCQLMASYGLVYLFTDILKVGSILQVVIKCLVDLFLFIFSYQIQRGWVFKNKK